MQQFDIGSARHDPRVEVLPLLLYIWTADPSDTADCALEPQQRFGDATAIWVCLVDLGARLRGPPSRLRQGVRPTFAIKEPRGPRKLIPIHTRKRTCRSPGGKS